MKNIFWKLFLLSLINTMLKVSLAQSEKQCIGKHQIPIKHISDYEVLGEIYEPLDLTNFDTLPDSTILANNDHTIVITLKYKQDRVPTVNFRSTAVPGTYRFEFLYFQWFENTTIPAELHAVFYNIKLNNLQKAMGLKNNIVVFAFALKIEPMIETQFAGLQGNLRNVSIGRTKIPITNLPLKLWLADYMREYVLYEGFLTFFNCETQVLFVDFIDTLKLETELLNEFEQLQTYDGAPLMEQYKTFAEPKGPLVGNYGDSGIDGAGLKGIAFVVEDMGSGGSTFQRLETGMQMGVLILFFEIIITFY